MRAGGWDDKTRLCFQLDLNNAVTVFLRLQPEPQPRYGAGGMRADGWDEEDAPPARQPADSRSRQRLRAQGRLPETSY